MSENNNNVETKTGVFEDFAKLMKKTCKSVIECGVMIAKNPKLLDNITEQELDECIADVKTALKDI